MVPILHMTYNQKTYWWVPATWDGYAEKSGSEAYIADIHRLACHTGNEN